MEVRYLRSGLDKHRLTGRQQLVGAIEAGDLLAIDILHHHLQTESVGLVVVVLHLRLHTDHGLATRDVEVGGVDVDARSAEVRVERQRLVEFAGDVQPHVLRQTAVVGVEILVVPLVAAVVYAVTVSPRVVAAHGNDVLARLDKRCDIKAEGHHAIVREPHLLAIHPHVGTLTGTLELDEELRTES